MGHYTGLFYLEGFFRKVSPFSAMTRTYYDHPTGDPNLPLSHPSLYPRAFYLSGPRSIKLRQSSMLPQMSTEPKSDGHHLGIHPFATQFGACDDPGVVLDVLRGKRSSSANFAKATKIW